MRVHKNIIKVTISISICTFIAYTILYFSNNSIDNNSLLVWGNQIMIAICTSSLVTALVSFVSYCKIKKEYYERLGKDLHRLFDIVDDYLVCLENNELYFDEYYLFRKEFLNYIIICEKEPISLRKKDGSIMSKIIKETYLIPRNMLYYSYKAVKRMEYNYVKENDSENKEHKYYELLNEELKCLNDYLNSLKKCNAYNESAFYFCEKAGIKKGEISGIDDFETKYRNEFYNQ